MSTWYTVPGGGWVRLSGLKLSGMDPVSKKPMWTIPHIHELRELMSFTDSEGPTREFHWDGSSWGIHWIEPDNPPDLEDK